MPGSWVRVPPLLFRKPLAHNALAACRLLVRNILNTVGRIVGRESPVSCAGASVSHFAPSSGDVIHGPSCVSTRSGRRLSWLARRSAHHGIAPTHALALAHAHDRVSF